MIKPAKKRKGDANQVAYSIVQDVIALSNRPIVPPPLKKPKKKRDDFRVMIFVLRRGGVRDLIVEIEPHENQNLNHRPSLVADRLCRNRNVSFSLGHEGCQWENHLNYGNGDGDTTAQRRVTVSSDQVSQHDELVE